MGPDKPDIIGKMQGSQPSNNMISLLKEIRDNTKNLSGGKEKKDFRRKEDPNKFVDNIEPLLDAQLKIQKESLGLQKDQNKKNGKGLLGLFGGLASLAAGALMAGGLIGFILTGKQEFLFSVIKGFKKLYFDIPKMMVQSLRIVGNTTRGIFGFLKAGKEVKEAKLIGKTLKETIESGGKFGKAARKMHLGEIEKLGELAKKGGKVGATAFKELATLQKMGGHVGSAAASTAGKSLSGMSKAGKVVSKAKGIAKGATRIAKAFKGGGIRGATKAISRMSKAGKVAGIASKATSKAAAKKIPVVGSLLALWFAIERFKKGDFVGGLLEISSGLAGFLHLVPGVGTVAAIGLQLLIDGIILIRDLKGIKPQEPKETKPKKTTDWTKIPVIGGFVQMFKGIGLMASGQPTLGAKQALVGLISAIPLPGMKTLASFLFPVIDAADWLVNKTGALLGKGVEAVKGIKLPSLEEMKQIPVIGTIISGVEGIIDFAKEPKKGIENIVNMVSSVNPTAGMVLGKAAGFVFGAADWFKDKAGKLGIKVKETAGALLKSDEEVQKKLDEQVDATTGADKADKAGKSSAPVKKGGWFHRLGQKTLKSSISMNQAATDFNEKAHSKAMKDAPGDGIQDIKGQRGNGWFANKLENPNLGVNPKVWDNFQSMSSEYFNETGRMFQINSALRPSDRDSVHSSGYAMDVNSPEVEEAESMGLLEKYGFHRPLIDWGPKETWHLEPYPGKEYGARNSNNVPFRRGLISGVSQIGGDNLPKDKIETPIVKNSNTPIELSESTIKSLANAIGVSFKGALPTPRPNQVSIDMGMRG